MIGQKNSLHLMIYELISFSVIFAITWFWLYGKKKLIPEEKNFIKNKEYQYCFITSKKGEILYSKYKKEDKKFETEIEKQISYELKYKKQVIFSRIN